MDLTTLQSKIPLLQGLPQDTLDGILLGAEIHEHQKGHELFHEGGPADCLFLLLSGIVELYTGKPRLDAVVLMMWAGDVFIPAATLTGEPYLLSGRALTTIKILQFEARSVIDQIQQSQEFARRLLDTVSGQFRRTVRHLKELKVRTGPQRVAAFMLRLVDETAEGAFADLPVSKAAIASRLDLAPESFSRALRELARHGLAIRGSRISITDRETLERFCNFDPLVDGAI